MHRSERHGQAGAAPLLADFNAGDMKHGGEGEMFPASLTLHDVTRVACDCYALFVCHPRWVVGFVVCESNTWILGMFQKGFTRCLLQEVSAKVF